MNTELSVQAANAEDPQVEDRLLPRVQRTKNALADIAPGFSITTVMNIVCCALIHSQLVDPVQAITTASTIRTVH